MRSAWRKSANFFEPELKQEELRELEKQTLEPDFWKDQSTAQQITQKMSRLKQPLEQYQKWCQEVSDLAVLTEMAMEV